MVHIEACCGSVDDALAAEDAGVDRIELNSSLFLGGLTPSIGALRIACERLDIPVMAMIRPRGGGFSYTDTELESMLLDIDFARQAGAAGVVFGVLTPGGTVDMERNALLVDRASGLETVFHRAVDVVGDMSAALDSLIELGITRVLTTGGAPDPWPVLDRLADLVVRAGDAIEILIGGSQPWNWRDILHRTGASQLHIAQFVDRTDSSCTARPEVYFGGALYPSETRYQRLDGGWTADFVADSRGSTEATGGKS